MSDTQQIFSPIENGFRWIQNPDNGEWWYEYDGKPAEQAALKARNDWAREQQKKGRKVRKSSLGRQLRSMGGIGTPYPHIELLVPCYMAEVVG